MRTSVLAPGLAWRDRKGQTLVEFALISIMLLGLLFGVIEVGRIMLVETTISNAARVGTRYAIVNGSDGSGSWSGTSACPTSPDLSNVLNAVCNFLQVGPLDTSSASVTASYPDTGACKNPGCRVTVTVSYRYKPMLTYYSFSITLQNTSEGVITW